MLIAVPLLTAGLLTSDRLVLSNVPRIADIATMAELLQQHGVAVENAGGDSFSLSIGGEITSPEAPYEIVSKMRASPIVVPTTTATRGPRRSSGASAASSMAIRAAASAIAPQRPVRRASARVR